MTLCKPPSTASIATDADKNGKMYAPSAARNANHICDTLKAYAARAGRALEIASGTGQHIVTFATAMPQIHWYPTEVDAARMRSIQAYLAEANLTNIAPPILLNATQSGWGKDVPPVDLITLANLLHLISKAEVETLVSQAAQVLTKGGQLFLYGPFKRDGKLISAGDMDFDASIRAFDPETGYKDDIWITAIARQNGLTLDQSIEMPANNLTLVFEKSL